jgi:hypothetical protein
VRADGLCVGCLYSLYVWNLYKRTRESEKEDGEETERRYIAIAEHG